MARFAGILLAAGRGTRMGRPKALLRWGRDTFVARLSRTWSAALQPVIVVAGADFQEVQAAAAPSGAAVVLNPRFDQGMLTSLQVGLSQLPESVEGVLVGGVDQPLPDAGLILDLIAAAPEPLTEALVPIHDGAAGHPVLLPRALFAELCALPPWSSLRGFLADHPDVVRHIPVERPEALWNINTPEEYRVLMASLTEPSPGDSIR